MLVALIDGLEQPLEIFIHRTGVVRIGMLEGLLDAVFRYQSLVFGKGDEQQAIQQLLRGIDKFEGRPLRVVLDEMGQQQFSEGFVVLIELVGDVLVRLLALVQQGQGVAGKQVVRVQQQDEAGVFFGFGEPGQVKALVHQGRFADRIQAQFHIVAHQHPLRPLDVAGIVPGLLYGSLVPAGHDGVQIAGSGALQLQGRNDAILLFVLGEMPQGQIHRTAGNAVFPGNGPIVSMADGFIAKNADHDVLGKGCVYRYLILAFQDTVFDTILPVC